MTPRLKQNNINNPPIVTKLELPSRKNMINYKNKNTQILKYPVVWKPQNPLPGLFGVYKMTNTSFLAQ